MSHVKQQYWPFFNRKKSFKDEANWDKHIYWKKENADFLNQRQQDEGDWIMPVNWMAGSPRQSKTHSETQCMLLSNHGLRLSMRISFRIVTEVF